MQSHPSYEEKGIMSSENCVFCCHVKKDLQQFCNICLLSLISGIWVYFGGTDYIQVTNLSEIRDHVRKNTYINACCLYSTENSPDKYRICPRDMLYKHPIKYSRHNVLELFRAPDSIWNCISYLVDHNVKKLLLISCLPEIWNDCFPIELSDLIIRNYMKLFIQSLSRD